MIAASERFGWGAAAGLGLVVAVPVAFVALQAIFPEIGAGSFAKPFAHLPKLLDDPKLIRLTFNTLALGVGVSVLAAAIAVPPMRTWPAAVLATSLRSRLSVMACSTTSAWAGVSTTCAVPARRWRCWSTRASPAAASCACC